MSNEIKNYLYFALGVFISMVAFAVALLTEAKAGGFNDFQFRGHTFQERVVPGYRVRAPRILKQVKGSGRLPGVRCCVTKPAGPR